LRDSEEGGGRLLGEGCHFVDLLIDLAGSPPTSAYAAAVTVPGRAVDQSDDIAAIVRFPGGAVGTLLYSGSGDPGLSKERVEAYGGGFAAVIDDFRRLELYRSGKRVVIKSRQDKGHAAEIAAFVRAVRGKGEIPSAQSYCDSTRATLALVDSLRAGVAVDV